jgi:protein dpy-30
MDQIDYPKDKMDPEYQLDNPEETIIGQQKAMTTVTAINPLCRTFRSYMDDFVNPLLFEGLQTLVRERPENPVEFLAYYLIQKNPKLNPAEDPDAGDADQQNDASCRDTSTVGGNK